jgi:serine kinase of HPr protein (carbohydrate metabolism regulator)
MGYKSNIENITAILYELVLVPLNYFFSDKALVHASSMKNSTNGKTVMFGGTGGVGKTSLELLLCRELGYSFISDDIAVIDKKGFVYSNLAYPKIYAYNAEGNQEIENLLFNKRSSIDKLQWKLSKNIRGLNKARRTISPDEIYKSVEKDKNIIN